MKVLELKPSPVFGNLGELYHKAKNRQVGAQFGHRKCGNGGAAGKREPTTVSPDQERLPAVLVNGLDHFGGVFEFCFCLKCRIDESSGICLAVSQSEQRFKGF